jgi:hypothetical protein
MRNPKEKRNPKLEMKVQNSGVRGQKQGLRTQDSELKTQDSL